MHTPTTSPLRKAEIFVFRVPIDQPVKTSFGTMLNRPAVLLRLEDEDGIEGWGETWCNFPSCGAEHRGHLLEENVLPHALGKAWATPEELSDAVAKKIHILRLQTDEQGPLSQCIAGLDIALWDLFARRAGKPVHTLLGDAGMVAMPAYASGINHPNVAKIINRSREEGYRIFKVKIGFGEEQDRDNLETALKNMREGELLACDVNQAWTLDTALKSLPTIEKYPLLWLEEPIACDRPMEEWHRLCQATTLKVAAGENMRSDETFEAVLAARDIHTIQPDICKWGGLSKCRKVAMAARKAGLRYCPHYLGGGIGLLASAHLLAAVGGDGMLEVDCNPNPLRENLAKPFPKIKNGLFTISDAPGLGVAPDMVAVEKLCTFHAECHV